MMRAPQSGMTLTELVIAIAVMTLIAGAAAGVLAGSLQAEAHGMSRASLHTEGVLAMERMTDAIRVSSYVLVPNGQNPTRDVLAVSGLVNNDGDHFFDDPLFPRVDEDPGRELIADGQPGIAGIDDDGDGRTDEGSAFDDDEDGAADEDPVNGVDDDGDGSVDEDPPSDKSGEGHAGVQRIDDNGDGIVNNGAGQSDDDEDGSANEDAIEALVFAYDAATSTLTQSVPSTGVSTPVSSQVSQFEAFFEAPERIRLTLTLTNAEGESVAFVEYAFPRNTLQRTGKRVR